MYKILMIEVLLLSCVKVEGVPKSYPVNRWGCTYPCYYFEDNDKCREFCLILGGQTGYCYWYTCYCENLPESVKQIKHQKIIGCSNGSWVVSSTTAKP
uniref:NaTx n=1 Tax=Centruroides hentzi TaxID=88313 RepID=A0A2I9LPB4_9SCOR